MAETTQANRSQNVTKQMKQKKFSLLVSGAIICALLLPVGVIGRLQHPEIEANWLKTWMLSDTTDLGFRPLLLYFLPQLPDFRTTNTFMSCRRWLTSSTLAPLIITRAFQRKRPSWNSGFIFIFVRSQIAVKSSSRMRDVWLMSTWHGVITDVEKLSRCKISTDTVYNTFKTHTRYAQIVRGRTTQKDVERFRNESVREHYERPLYEQTFMSEPFMEKHTISTELSDVNREKHRKKSHHTRKRDREPSRIPIRSLKS